MARNFSHLLRASYFIDYGSEWGQKMEVFKLSNTVIDIKVKRFVPGSMDTFTETEN